MTKSRNPLLSNPSYSPNVVIDALISRMGLPSDAELARRLDVAPPVISKLRHHKLPLGASLIISMHEASGISIRELKAMAGLKCMARLA
jgi:plasmid maintenance system antidote protein VapI